MDEDKLIQDLDGDSYGEDMDEVAELDAKANFAGLKGESIVGPDRRISSMRILNMKKQGSRPPKRTGTLAKWSPALFAGW